MYFRWLSSLSPRSLIICNLLVTIGLTWLGTQFHYPAEVLAASSWGGGVPSTSAMTAFATARPWWNQLKPEGAVPRPDGGLEPLVRIPRKEIRETGTPLLPTRGIGYEAWSGSATALRSGFSPDLIFDFPLLVRLQQWLLVLCWTLLPIGCYWLCDRLKSPIIFFYFNCAQLLLLLLRPNKARFLTEGILDSALANALALGAVVALWALLRAGSFTTGTNRLIILLSGIYLSFCTQVRGEFFFIFYLVFIYLFSISFFRFIEIRKGIILGFLFFHLFPVGYGLFNYSRFGHFVPFRMQTGQNLVEPIGQYPNPFGIEYRDEWVMEYLEKQGIEYISFEADQVLTRRYFEMLREKPGMFFHHFYLRVSFFSRQFGYLLNIWTLPVVLCGIYYFSFKSKDWCFLFIPLFLAIGYFLFFGWTNNLLRLVTPIHFLLNAFICVSFLFWKTHRNQLKKAET